MIFKLQLRSALPTLSVCILAGLATTAAADTIEFRNAHVVDVRTGSVLENQVVRVDGETIVAVAPAAQLGEFKADQVIDVEGAFLAPGLMDMHFHVPQKEHLTLSLLRGVTTLRNMWGNPETLAWRAEIEEGAFAGSRIVTAGMLVDGSPKIWPDATEMTDPSDAYAFVRGQKRAGYQFVKPYSRLQPAVFDAILDAGRELDMEIAGHVPQDSSLLDAIDGGMRTSEHLIGVLKAVARDQSLPNPSLTPYDKRAEELVLAFGSGEQPIDDYIDPERVAEVASAARRNGHWFVPTLRVMNNFGTSPVEFFPDLERFAGPMEMQMMPLIKSGTAGKVFFGMSDELQKGEDQHQILRRRLVRALHEAGAPILAGTDSFQAGAGTILVDELRELEGTGIPRADVLRFATLEPARYLRREGELGEIRVGAIADIIVIKENPLDDLAALYRPSSVMKAGVWYDAKTVEEMLEATAKALNSKPVDGTQQEH